MPFPIGAIFSGDPMGAYQKGKTGALDDQYSALAGKALQDMFQSQVPGAGPVPGAPIQGVQPVQGLGQQGPGGPQQAAGGSGQPPAPGGAGGGPQAGGGPARQGSILPGGAQIMGMNGGGPQPQQPQQPGGQQGGQQQGGQQPPLGQGPLTLQQAVQSIVKAAGPKANPQLIMGALQKMLPALNAQGIQQYRELSLGIREQSVMQSGQRLQQQQSQFDEREQRLREQESDKTKRWETLDKQRAQNMQLNQDKFQNALRNKQVSEARGAIADYDRQTSQFISEAANLGKPLPPEAIDAIHKRRQKMVDQADALRAQPQQGLNFQDRIPSGGGMSTQPAAPPVRDLTQ